MSEFTTWVQSNWYELGNLLAEFVFLCVGIWFARKILRTLRASQEQVGTLIKLSVAGAVPERQPASTAAERSFATGSPYWLTPSETPSAAPSEPIEDGATRLSNVGHGIVAWLNTPMKTGSAEAPAVDQSMPIEDGASRSSNAGHGIVAWLNTPMKTGSAAPWRRAIKWLQSPAGS